MRAARRRSSRQATMLRKRWRCRVSNLPLAAASPALACASRSSVSGLTVLTMGPPIWVLQTAAKGYSRGRRKEALVTERLDGCYPATDEDANKIVFTV